MEASYPRLTNAHGYVGAENGGFPEPPPGERVRLVRVAHGVCGAETRIRLPGSLSADVVRRVVCSGCAEPYACGFVEDISPNVPIVPIGEPIIPLSRRALAYASVPLAAAAVIIALLLIQGRADETGMETTVQPGNATGGEGQAQAGDPPGNAELVRESNFTLAIPPGWERSTPPRGATFAATASDGSADATLWIEQDPNLTIGEFEAESLERLDRIAENVRVEERILAPTDADTVIRLRADAPAGEPGLIDYEVTLRTAGPFRYYLVTSTQPDASSVAGSGVQLIHGSFIPGATDANTGGE